MKPLVWQRGVLKEDQYSHFRHDQPLGSFNPHHVAKWTAHELCHGLVGFAWSPYMTTFAHTLSARLSELLPIALLYFLDEAQLRRCPLHYLQGPLFSDRCLYCETLATKGPRLPELEDQSWLQKGVDFVRAELNAVARSRRFGRPLPNRFATLDLNSDAMTYMVYQKKRMQDPLFRQYIDLFHGPDTGMWSDLDELEDRLWGLTETLSGGLPSNPLKARRPQWIAQDIGWRLLTIAGQCEDTEAIDALETMAETMSKSPKSLHLVIQKYQTLHDEFFIPPPQQMFAVGYDLGGGWGWDLDQAVDGVISSCPELSTLLDRDELSEQVSAFIPWDLKYPRRQPIGRRFSQFLAETAQGPLADLALYESAIHHPDPPDPWAMSLGWDSEVHGLIRRAQGVEVIEVSIEIDRLIEAIHSEEELDFPERNHALLIVNRRGGERHVAEISSRAVRALNQLKKMPIEEELLGLDQEELKLLKDLGALTPCAWNLEEIQHEKDESPIVYLENEDEDRLLPDAFDGEVHFDPTSVSIDYSPLKVQGTQTHSTPYEKEVLAQQDVFMEGDAFGSY
jgi:hypothetical protein